MNNEGKEFKVYRKKLPKFKDGETVHFNGTGTIVNSYLKSNNIIIYTIDVKDNIISGVTERLLVGEEKK